MREARNVHGKATGIREVACHSTINYTLNFKSGSILLIEYYIFLFTVNNLQPTCSISNTFILHLKCIYITFKLHLNYITFTLHLYLHLCLQLFLLDASLAKRVNQPLHNFRSALP